MVRIDSNSSANCATELKDQEWRLTMTRMSKRVEISTDIFRSSILRLLRDLVSIRRCHENRNIAFDRFLGA